MVAGPLKSNYNNQEKTFTLENLWILVQSHSKFYAIEPK